MTTLQPVGTPHENIIMWDSTVASIPEGWILCDGTLGTPDLRSRFTLGVPTAGTNPGTLGGEDTHVLLEAELAAHDHPIVDPTHFHFYGTNNFASAGNSGERIYSSETLASANVTDTGSDTAHENRPAFYALVFIQRE